MNEATTRRELIDPKLTECGWGQNVTTRSVVIAEHEFTDGRIIGGGQRGKRKKADYLLRYKNHNLAIVEAKAEGKYVTEGLEQVKDYAKCLNIRYVYSTNGHGIYMFDMLEGRGFEVDGFYHPDDLYKMTLGTLPAPQQAALTEPFRRTKFSPRYYQENAINAAVSAISAGDNRILLTLATGTGKTFISFQIVWKLYQSRWNKRGNDRRPRVLFIADRNVLVEQAMSDFAPLDHETVRVNGEKIRKDGKIPTNGNIFFSIYQAIAGGPRENPYYKDYPKDFFDLVVIDECHRGGASNESSWREVLDHFSAATHLGLTATPKRDDNVDTYEYFGEPRYTYSLKDGIEDGFLTPFKVKRVQTTMDRYTFTPHDSIESGEVDQAREYTLDDFNRAIYLPEREERMAQIMLEQINPEHKTIIFCNDETHALMIRDAVNKYKTNSNPNYCVRITASEGKIGDEFLKDFRDNEKMIPTVVTTSRKLSTGVDARNVRFIVLMRNVGSMIEFKQIVGRGTRVYDNKDYFTIVDFYGNDAKFQDPEWDGEPVAVEKPTVKVEDELTDGGSVTYGELEDESGEVNEPVPTYDGGQIDDYPEPKQKKTVVHLADGKAREIQYSSETLFYLDGKAVSPQVFLERLFGELPELFKTEDELREKWSDPRTRTALLLGLAERGFDEEKLQALKNMIDAQDSDVYDVLRYIAYARDTMTRLERAGLVREYYFEQLEDSEREFVEFILKTYETEGENELTLENLSGLVRLKYHTMKDAITRLGEPREIVHDYLELQKELYAIVES